MLLKNLKKKKKFKYSINNLHLMIILFQKITFKKIFLLFIIND